VYIHVYIYITYTHAQGATAKLDGACSVKIEDICEACTIEDHTPVPIARLLELAEVDTEPVILLLNIQYTITYGVATISRLLKIICLCCKRAL